MKDDIMNVGFIGIGQGGGNIVNTFAKKHDKCMALNTTTNDLTKLDNINKDLRILTPNGTNGGGAGKDPMLGERALRIETNVKKVKQQIELNFNNCDLIWVTVALGGGTGTLGAIQLIEILTSMGREHGLICAIPTEEDCIQKRNALLSLERITMALSMSDSFNPVIMIDNNYIKTKAEKESEKGTNAEVLDKANQYIYDDLTNLAEYARRASDSRSFDPQDYKKQFTEEKGTILFSSVDIPIEGYSDNSLYAEVSNSWENNGMYIIGDISTVTGMTVIVEHPKEFDKFNMISSLYDSIKENHKGVNVNDGIYEAEGKNGFMGFGKSGEKVIRVHTLLTGMAFPDFTEFKKKTIEEYKLYMSKKNNDKFKFEVNINELTNTKPKKKKSKGQKINLSVYDDEFDEFDDSQPLRINDDPYDWTESGI